MAVTLQRHDDPPLWPIVGIDHWFSEADAQALAVRLAHGLTQGPEMGRGRITLEGELGAGKTTWVRHLLRALGVRGTIKSPTYAVMEPHLAHTPRGDWEVAHFDCYRFSDPQEWDDAGFRDTWDVPGLKLCEWPDRVPGLAASADWRIHIEHDGPTTRQVKVMALTPLGLQWLQGVAS